MSLYEKQISERLENGGKIDWEDVVSSEHISEEFIEKHRTLFGRSSWYWLFVNDKFSEKFIMRCIDYLMHTNSTYINWYGINRNYNFNEEFFENLLKICDEDNYHNFCYNTTLTEEFFEKHMNIFILDYRCWYGFCCHPNLSLSFFKKYKKFWENNHEFSDDLKYNNPTIYHELMNESDESTVLKLY